MVEEWKPIDGHLDLYEVSNMGNVRRKSDGKLLSTHTPGKIDGYCRIGLKDELGYGTRTVHSLVACAFIPRKEGETQIHHKDGNKTNNCVDNLEWVDPHEHGKLDAKRRSKAGIKTKHHDNWVARKNIDFEKLALRVPFHL